MITIHNKQRRISFDKQRMHGIVEKILELLNYEDFDIGVLITNNKNIREYNRTYRNKDKATDILSFSYHPELQPGKRIKVKTEEDKNLGDLVLSLEYIQKSAQELDVPFNDRLTTLLIHGILHLLGYDHETDAQWRSMRAKEAFIAKKLNLKEPS